MSTILLAVTGLSPAIVTETLWALAQERPAVLPTRVIFITTSIGAERLEEQLFRPQAVFGGETAWQALRAALQAGENELIAEAPRIIGVANEKTGLFDPLPDIRTPEHNRLAAGFILEEVRRIVENPDLRLVASIAGGRKTMGALLHAAVSLIGREQDRLTHVLVDAPYETMPDFFFPAQPGPALKDREGREHRPSEAQVRLADVPFVPLRNRFRDLDEIPGSFEGLVRKFSHEIKQDAERPYLVEFCYREKCLWVDQVEIKASIRALAILHGLLHAQKEGRDLASQKEAAEYLGDWLERTDQIPERLKPSRPTSGFLAADVSHDLGELRSALHKAGASWAIPRRSLHFPPYILRWRE